MTRPATNRDVQRATFVESLHISLQHSLEKQASKALADHKTFVTLASVYIDDGLSEDECVELLMIDGLGREAAESYTSMVTSKEIEIESEDFPEYSFQFEDSYGKIWSSYDIGKTVQATSDDDAWQKAEESVNDSGLEMHKILSVSRIS